MNLTDHIVNRVIAFQNEKIPDTVIHSAKRAMIDYCGVVINGAVKNENKTLAYIRNIGSDNKGHKLFGMDIKTDLYSAVLFNGFNAHLIELDDGHRFGMMHMGAPIISAVLNISEGRNISGDKQIRAIIAGYEIAIALAKQMQPGHKLKGYHATGTCCTVGCAMAVAVLLDFSAEQIKGALSAAATSAAGLLEVIDDSSELKPYNIGRAAMDGVTAAFIGCVGFNGPDDIVGGKRGFFAALADKDDFHRIVGADLFGNNDYLIQGIYFKPYAACRHCHPAIEAAINIRNQIINEKHEFISHDMIDTIVVKTYKLAIKGHDHTSVTGVSSAKMSTPFSLVTALLTWKAGVQAYSDENLNDPVIAELMKKTTIIADDELDKLNPQKRAAIVEVHLINGETFVNRVDYPRGEPENPITDAELEEKMRELFKSVNRQNADEVISCVWEYEKQADKLIELL